MIVTYRGHRIEVTREKSMGGELMLFFSIFRLSDGYECNSGFSSGADTVRDMVRYLREQVDEELAQDDPWGESE